MLFARNDAGLDADEESQLSNAQGVIDELEVKNERAMEVVRDNQERIRELEEKIHRLNKKADEELSAARLGAKEKSEKVERYRRERGDARTEAASLKGQVEELRQREEEHQRNAGALQQQVERQSELLQIRGAELRDALAYLAKDDSVSCTDIISMLEYLNSEIFQVCAQIADIWENVPGDSVDLSGAAEVLQGHFGSATVKVLGAIRARDYDELAAQMVLQASLLQAADEIIMAWVPSMNAAEDQLVRQVYGRIYESGWQCRFQG